MMNDMQMLCGLLVLVIIVLIYKMYGGKAEKESEEKMSCCEDCKKESMRRDRARIGGIGGI